MSTRILPVVKSGSGGSVHELADMIDLARQGFVATEDQLLTAVNKVPTLLQPSPSA
jgi:hypothetical protein